MNDAAVAIIVLVPVLAICLVLILLLFFKSREKQMMIERGMSASEITEIIRTKKTPYTLVKLGVIVFCFGLGLGIGLLLGNFTGVEEFIPFFIFTFTGAGFVLAHYAAKRFEKKENGKSE